MQSAGAAATMRARTDGPARRGPAKVRRRRGRSRGRPRLLAKCREEGDWKIVFAERTRRSESWVFRIFYVLYKAAHRLLTGSRVRVGNFSVVPRSRLSSLVVVSELWNHDAAAFKSRQPYCLVPTRRAKRLHGHSSMNFVALVVHGLSAISVYSEIVGVRLLVFAFGLILLTLSSVAGVVFVRRRPTWRCPGGRPPPWGSSSSCSSRASCSPCC